jgi:hypothetical protein
MSDIPIISGDTFRNTTAGELASFWADLHEDKDRQGSVDHLPLLQKMVLIFHL